MANHAYVGSRTTRERNARGEGISVYEVGPEGELTLIQLVRDLVNPSFLALNRAKSRLYTVHGDGNEISTFSVSPADGKISRIGRRTFVGRNPVHLALDGTETSLVVSDHLGTGHGGSLIVLPILDDGTVGETSQKLELEGLPGPHRKEQPFAKPHFNPFDPSGKFILVPDKGLDKVFVFSFAEGRARPACTPWVKTRSGAGPRHLAFHPHAPFVYVVNELDSTVAAYRFDASNGGLEPFQILSCLPDTFTGDSTASEIEISRSGKTLYASNRGSDSIAVFGVDANDGRLRLQDVVHSHGRTPRFFTLGPKGDCLYVLNEDSDNIVRFFIDPATGMIGSRVGETSCASPVCLVF